MTISSLNFDAQALREKILDLAMRGKLVPQNPDNEPASVLFEKIKAEKAELVKEGKIKKSKKLPEITEDEKPFAIPDSWEWVRLGEVCKKITDGTHNPPPNSGKGKQVISAINIKNNKIDFSLSNRFVTDTQFIKEDTRTEIRKGDILLTVVGTLGSAAVVETDKLFTAQRSLAILKPMVLNYFLLDIIESPMFSKQINDNAKGTTQRGIYLKKLTNLLIPLPPLEEQSRIADKIAQLFALLRKVESSTNDYAELQKMLHDKVLDLAMRGKLVEQDPSDEPADVLLEKIKAEKEQLVKDGKIKKSKPLPPISEDEKPFDIPDSWEWVRLGDVTNLGNTVSVKPEDIEIGKPLIELADIESYTAKLINQEETTPSIKSNKFKYREGDVLFAKLRPYLKKVLVATNDGYCTSELLPVKGYLINNEWIYYTFLSSMFFRQIEKQVQGINLPRINPTKMKNMVIPIPPLEEQSRIIRRISSIIKALS